MTSPGWLTPPRVGRKAPDEAPNGLIDQFADWPEGGQPNGLIEKEADSPRGLGGQLNGLIENQADSGE